MKSTGIVRKVDNLGRIVLPMELRRVLAIGVKDPIEIFTEEKKIVLQKYKPRQACQVTGQISEDNLVLANGHLVLSQEAAKQVYKDIENQIKEPMGAR